AKSMGHYLVVQCGRDGNSDAAIFDLHYNPDDYTTMSAEELIGVMNSKAKAIRALRANRQPIMMPAELAPEGCKALKISADERDRRIKVIRDNKDFQDRVCTALANRYADAEPPEHLEQQIYSGGFAKPPDEARMITFHTSDWPGRAAIADEIEDGRLRE